MTWRRFFRRRRADSDLQQEFAVYLDEEIAENRARGMSADEAQRQARIKLGSPQRVREELWRQNSFATIDNLVRDLKYAARALARSPGFALTAVLTLGLGLGANTAIFSLINGLLLRPLPVPHADQLAVFHYVRSDDSDPNFSFCAPIFRVLEKRHDVFQNVAAYSNRTLQVRSGSGNVSVPGIVVSGQFFTVLQTPAVLGRYLTPQDDQPGGTPAGFGVVISEGFWHTWFHSTPDVVGRRLTIANAPFTVVGVMPQRFIGADPTERPEIYAPMWSEPVIDAPYNNIAGGHHNWWLRVIARLNPRTSLQQANAALQATTNPVLDDAISDQEWIKSARKNHFQLIAAPGSSGFTYLRELFVKPLAAVFSMCEVMLLLACLNLASLLMARSAARERELATRLAMGATRGRLIHQLMVESLLIAAMGTAAGMIATPLVSRLLATLILSKSPGATLDTALDLRVSAFVALTAFIATMLIGLLPALRATSKGLSDQIKSGSHTISSGERSRSLPRILMALEVALALILVVGAGLLSSSLVRLYRTGLGFNPKGVAALSLDMGKQSLDGDPLFRWYRGYGDALLHQPGVKSVSFAAITPMDGSVWTRDYHTPLSGGDREIYMDSIAPGFFQTMDIPVLAGRDFFWNDTLSTGRKIILNQAAAKKLFPGRNAIGQQIISDKDSFEVIAVVGDIHYASIRKEAPAGAYIPMSQDSGKKPSYTAVVRIEGSAVPLATAARELATQMAPDIPAPVMTTLSTQLDDSISSERMLALLAVFFAASALLVTAIGLYGTLAYATARRTSEIGIRLALGAKRRQVVALVFRRNAGTAAYGLLLGVLVALFATRALATFLYGTSARDLWVLAGSVSLLAIIASAASIIPALRAARIQPTIALRSE